MLPVFSNTTKLNLEKKYLLDCTVCKHLKSEHEFRNLPGDEDLQWICWKCIDDKDGVGIVPPNLLKEFKVPYSCYHKFPDNLEIVEQLAKERNLL